MNALYIKGIKKASGEKWLEIQEGAKNHQEFCKDTNFDSVDFLIMEFKSVMGYYP